MARGSRLDRDGIAGLGRGGSRQRPHGCAQGRVWARSHSLPHPDERPQIPQGPGLCPGAAHRAALPDGTDHRAGSANAFGFFLTDFPHNVDETPQHIPIGQIQWWLLYGLCHQEDIDAALLDRLAPANSEFRGLPRAATLWNSPGILLDKAPPLSGPRFMRAISTVEGRELQDIIDLMATYRELRVHFLRDREGRRQ